MQLLRRMFNFARITPNPAGNKAVNFFQERPRDRYLLGDELPRFFKALDDEPNETLRDFFYVALWTGARRGNVQVSVGIPEGLPQIQAAHPQLPRGCTHLLMNASEAMGGTGHVCISASRLRLEDGVESHEAVLVQVSDDGPGIPADVAEKVFDPFFTTKPQGSGLGLAIDRKIVDAHDGRIDLRTAVGQGTTIRVTLPVTGSDED